MQEDVIVVGAGVAGLSLARQLARRGIRVRVIERARGVGGRCATRRIDGRPVDHGVPLLHGRGEEIREAFEEMEGAGLLPGWPGRVVGEGTACQPQAYDTRSRRLAVEEGVSAFAKHLARDVEVELETPVVSIERRGDGFELACEDRSFEAPTVVVTAPAPHAARLLAPLADDGREIQALHALVRRVAGLACLTVIAGYDRPVDAGWDLRLPGSGSPVHTLVNDSTKRPDDGRQVLVVQGTPAFSRERLDAPPEDWGRELVAAAGRELGEWAAEPAWRREHAWHFARVQRGDEMAHPVLLGWKGDARLGLCGDAWHPAGGLEGAYMSGIEMAARILGDAATEVD